MAISSTSIQICDFQVNVHLIITDIDCDPPNTNLARLGKKLLGNKDIPSKSVKPDLRYTLSLKKCIPLLVVLSALVKIKRR
jgi:hypothetical protein